MRKRNNSNNNHIEESSSLSTLTNNKDIESISSYENDITKDK